jgi:uncharacterized protein YjeT (DUF2065 family)
MSYRIWIYLVLIIIGLVVLAWPEQDDQMMIQLSKAHGPSTLDLIGLAIIFSGYVPLITPVFTKFSHIQQLAGKFFSRLLVFIAFACSLLIVRALVIDSEILLWTAVTISTSTQAILIYFVFVVHARD